MKTETETNDRPKLQRIIELDERDWYDVTTFPRQSTLGEIWGLYDRIIKAVQESRGPGK